MPDFAPITRRYFFLGTLAVGAACRRKPSAAFTRTAPVSIRRAASYQADLETTVRSILTEHRVDA